MAIVILAPAPAPAQPPAASDRPAPTEEQRFIRAAAETLAHGREREAESLARARDAGDPAAAAVLARIALRHARYEEALGVLRPPAAKVPTSEAALEMGLLQMTLGRKADGRRTLSRVLSAAGVYRTPEELARAARAARASSSGVR